jgi:hypothetical protein
MDSRRCRWHKMIRILVPIDLFRNNWALFRGDDSFSGVTGGRTLSFRGLDVGETAPPSLSRGMRSPASPKRDADKPLKRPVREPWNEGKGIIPSCFSVIS